MTAHKRKATRHPQARARSITVKPDQQDYEAVEAEYGPLSPMASERQLAHRYRLAQATKLIRTMREKS